MGVSECYGKIRRLREGGEGVEKGWLGGLQVDE